MDETKTAPRFEGHTPRECGEHRTTIGRAWCFDCSEWCSPAGPCRGCELPALRAELERLREQLRLANIDATNTSAELAAAESAIRDELDEIIEHATNPSRRDEYTGEYTPALQAVADLAVELEQAKAAIERARETP